MGDVNIDIDWTTRGFEGFIDDLADKSRDVIKSSGRLQLTVKVNSVFIDAFCALRSQHVDKVLQALRYSALKGLDFSDWDVRVDQLPLFGKLCTCFGSISTLDELCFSLSTRVSNVQAPVTVIQTLSNIREITFQGGAAIVDADYVAAFGGALKGHNQVQELYFSADRGLNYQLIDRVLPIMHTLTSLKRVYFDGDGTETTSPDDMRCLVGILMCPLALHFRRLRIPSGNMCQTFCNGIMRSRAKEMYLSVVEIDATPFANALLFCRAPMLSISRWPKKTRRALPTFIQAFAQVVPSMSTRTIFLSSILNPLNAPAATDDEDDQAEEEEETAKAIHEAISFFYRQAAENSTLQKLYLPVIDDSEAMDHALAVLVSGPGSKLQRLVLCASGLSAAQAVTSLPHFSQALRKNFTLEKLRFCTFNSENNTFERGGWVNDICQSLAAIPRLNGFGRNYMQTDPYNQCQGFKVLEQVKDDLNLLFIHLRENPALCKRRERDTAVTIPSANRKRKAPYKEL